MDRAGAVLLPTIQDGLQRVRIRHEGPNDGMHMIGHDHIAIELIALVVEVTQRRGDHLGLRWAFQQASAKSLIEPVFNSFVPLARQLFKSRVRPGRKVSSFTFLLELLQFVEFGVWDGIGQAKGDEVGRPLLPPMG
jgi:hypothetical protein